MKFCSLLSVFVLTVGIVSAQNSAVEDFIVKPYLQVGSNPGNRQLDLLWHAADADAKWQVELKAGKKAQWRKTGHVDFRLINLQGIPTHRVYRTTFEDLVPGTTFYYRILRNSHEVFSSWAHAPRDSAQAFSAVIFGDIGAGTPEQKPLAERAYLLKPNLVVVTGDIVYEDGLVSEYRTKFWPIYNADKSNAAGAPLMRSIPFIAAIGNHDTETRDLNKFPDALAYYMFWDQPLNGPVQAEGSASVPLLVASSEHRKAFLQATGKAYPVMTNFSYDYGDAHWTVIDSNPYVDWTSKELDEWVAQDLASAADKKWRFVIFHHPGFNSSVEHSEQQHMRLLSPVFEKGKVDVVFSGHVHNYQRSFPLTFQPFHQGTLMVGGKSSHEVRGRVVPGHWTLDKDFNGSTNTRPHGIIYIVTGAGGQTLYNPEQNNDPDSWEKFTFKFHSSEHSLTYTEFSGNTLNVKQIAADGHIIDSFRITK